MRRSVLLRLSPVLLALALCASPSRADYPIDVSVAAVTGSLEAVAGALHGPYYGVSHLLFNESEMTVDSISAEIDATELEDGTIVRTTTHLFSFGAGDSIQTLDVEILTPGGSPGSYNVSTTMSIVGGTGAGRAASGQFVGSGWLFAGGPTVMTQTSMEGYIFWS